LREHQPQTKSSPNRWLFVSDVDDTLLGDVLALRRLNEALAKCENRFIVVCNSSPPFASLRRANDQIKNLSISEYLLGELDTDIHVGSSGRLLNECTSFINYQWDRSRVADIVAEIGLPPHEDQYQTAYKASFDVKGPLEYQRVVSRVKSEALRVKTIYSGQINLDLIPLQAGKGIIIRLLTSHLQIEPNHVAVAGDSGNDVDIFIRPNKGIMVANADNDLKALEGDHIYQASAAYAEGVLEGWRYWGVLTLKMIVRSRVNELQHTWISASLLMEQLTR
jgi:sucrose-6F-phosphate phosphohydrolase